MTRTPFEAAYRRASRQPGIAHFSLLLPSFSLSAQTALTEREPASEIRASHADPSRVAARFREIPALERPPTRGVGQTWFRPSIIADLEVEFGSQQDTLHQIIEAHPRLASGHG